MLDRNVYGRLPIKVGISLTLMGLRVVTQGKQDWGVVFMIGKGE